MQFLKREEREERKYIHLRREEGQKTKKKEIAPYLARANLPPPRNTTKKDGIRFTNQRRRGDKKEDRRPEEDHGQEGALVSLSRGWFSDRIPIFFFVSLAQNGFVFFKGRRKNATKKRTKKAQHSHRRVSAHSPPKTALSTPSNARIERRNVPGVHRCAL